MSDTVTQTLRQFFPVPPGGRLQLRSDRGSIRIETADRQDVEVEVFRQVRTSQMGEAEKVLGAAKIEFSPEGSDLRLNARWEVEEDGPEVDLRFSITLPSRFHLDLATGGGNVEVGDIEGDVAAVANGGSLHLGRIRGNVRAETTGGSIRLAGCSGEAWIRSRGGRIRLDEVGDGINAVSQGGGISARLTAALARGGQLSTTGGSLEVVVPESIGFDVDASVVGGQIRSDMTVSPAAPARSRELAGSVNGGGAKLSLRAVGGNVTLKKG